MIAKCDAARLFITLSQNNWTLIKKSEVTAKVTSTSVKIMTSLFHMCLQSAAADRAPNSVLLDPLGIKPERDKMTSQSSAGHGRDDDSSRPRSKDSATAMQSRYVQS